MTDATIMALSAQTGEGLDGLIEALKKRVCVDEADGVLTVQRHIERARAAAAAMGMAVEAIEGGFPLDTVAIDIRSALESLSEITGENATEAVIDRIFADFCVGK